jgi:glycosyltransferase involved in cell wall biosynthesis
LIRSLSVIIPAYNEQSRLPETLERVSSFLIGRNFEFWEMLVVDDGSTDQTAEMAEAYSRSNRNTRLLKNPGNRGKGYSIRHGMLAARGEWRLFTDADLSAPIEDFAKLEHAVESKNAAVAIGSRGLSSSVIEVHQPAFRENAGKIFNLVMRAVTGLPFHDTQCGFKLFSARAAETAFKLQRLEGFGFDVEVLLIARLHGFRIDEVPVRWSHVEGTKVSPWKGAQSFLELLSIRANQMSGRYR